MENLKNQTGENDQLAKGKQPEKQDKPDGVRVATVTPDNENGEPGAPAKETASEKDKAPSRDNE
ncbi:hypothetical protein [Mucilaginibacter paludis]|uniref:Uncharacterized protein n=1 Tax=Mucilaginibacter paludis DSM 18603 TaxID=714943 RepID=H1YDH2_9SPHI|nr:hypothetical protein [Mucilaginibacter paludis]EHQ30181.1 hypothetical protein Mucpa_6123 [Mucilaginibacter paludis DSM 18603]